MRVRSLASLLVLSFASSLVACGSPEGLEATAPDERVAVDAHVHPIPQALFDNGGFEDGLNNWTVTAYQNNGLAAVPPTSLANLNLFAASTTLNGAITAGQTADITLASRATFINGTSFAQIEDEVLRYTGIDNSNRLTGVTRGVAGSTAAAHANGVAVTAARAGFARTDGVPQSQAFSGLNGVRPPAYPEFGTASAVINESPRGFNRNVTSLRQSFTSTFADVDPADNKVHVRWALAPALENPGHQPSEQPYFYLEVRNVSRGGAVMFSDFNFSNQPGVPWQVLPAGGGVPNPVSYTDWQIYDIAPGNGLFAPGETVEVEVYASGCSLGGHWGEVYVDGFGARLPGLSVRKTAPQAANLDTDITYAFTVQNNTGGLSRNILVDDVLPRNTTFESIDAPGATCVTPAAGTRGTIECTYDAMSNGETRAFSMVVHQNAFSASGTATGGSTTTLTTGQTFTADQWQGYTVYLTGGTGQGQQRTIMSNTVGGVLTIATPPNFGPVPAADTTFAILNAPEVLSTASATANAGTATLTDSSRTGPSAWVVNQWTGWTVTIVGGAGLGQSKTILANSASSLTVASNWTTGINNTSRYAINFPLGTLVNGNYGVKSQTQPSRLNGPPARTSLTTGVNYTDLSVAVSDGVPATSTGAAITYTITVRNNGSLTVTDASVTDAFPAGLTIGGWTCASTTGGTCGTPAGSGNTIAGILVTLPAGADVVFTVPATVTAANGSTLSNTATVAVPVSATDYDTTNNSDTDIDQVNPTSAVNVSKGGATGDGSVISAPAAISCGVGCTSQSASFAQGQTITLTAIPRTGDAFVGWSGDVCSGSTAQTCDVPVGVSATNVVATFRGPQTTGSAVGNGTVSCAPSPTTTGATVTCSITPNVGFELSSLTDNGTSVTGSVSGNAVTGRTYVIGNIVGDHAVIGTFVADVTAPAAPVLTAPADGSFTNDTTPSYSGTAEPGSTVTVRIGGTTVCTAATDGNGNWSCTPVTPRADGNYNVNATATDAASNTSAVSNTNNFTIDTAAPATPTITTPSNGSTTSDTTPTFTGTADPGTTVTVRVDGNVVCSTTATGGGTYSCTPTTPLLDGPRNAVATSTDAGGNATSSTTSAFTVDSTPPAAPVVLVPANGGTVTTNRPTYRGTAEPGSTVTVVVDGATACIATTTNAGDWSCTPAGAIVGEPHTVLARQVDLGGNTSADSATNTFTYAINDAPTNTVPPTVVLAEDTPTAIAVSVADPDASAFDIEVTLVATHGTLTLGATGSLTFLAGDGTNDAVLRFRGILATVNAALASLTYTPDANYNGPAQLTVTTNDLGSFGDGGAKAASDTVAITVTPVNDPPTLGDDVVAVRNDGGTVTIAVLANDSSRPDGAETLTVVSFTQPAHGTVSQVGNDLVYTPAAGYVGADPFTYTVDDGNGGSDIATVLVTSAPAGSNLPPVVAIGTAPSATEDTPVVLGAVISVSDPDAGAEELELHLTVDHGTLTLASTAGITIVQGDGADDAFMVVRGTASALTAALDGATVTPTADFNGPLVVDVFASDLGHTGTGGTRYDNQALTLNVAPANDSPSASDDDAIVRQDGAATTLSVLANDTVAPDRGEVLTITAVTAAAHGDVAIVGSQVTYTPAPGYAGADSFTYTVSDGNGGTDTATVNVVVVATGVNAGPVNRVPAAQSVLEDAPLAFNAEHQNSITVEDADAAGADLRVTLTATNGALSATGVNTVTVLDNGTATIIIEGAYNDVLATLASLVFTPAANYNGPATITMVTDDLGNSGSGGAQTDTDVIDITVLPVNDPPLALADVTSTPHDVAKTIDVLANDSVAADPGDLLTLISVSQPAHGTAVIVDGKILYTPNAGYAGDDPFTYVVTDEHGGYSTGNVQMRVLSEGELDPDEDGLTNDEEDESGTDQNNPDSDGDGIPDGIEVLVGDTDPLNTDSDGDGIADGVEDTNHNGVVDPGETDPNNADSDGGGVPDGIEDENHNGVVDPGESDPRNPADDASPDSDGDGIPDRIETANGINPDDPDSDGDGLPDGVEDVNRNGVVEPGETDPRNPDTDAGGVDDGTEVAQGTDPNDAGDDARYRLEGGGLGCAAAGTSGSTFALFALVAIGWLGRKRTSLLLAALVMLLPTMTFAQSKGFTINRYEPTPAGEWSFMVDHPWYSSTRLLAAGLTLNYAHDPLVYGLANPSGTDVREFRHVIQHQLIVHADFAVSFRDRITLSASLPAVLLEDGANADGTGPLAGATIGDPRVGGMVRIYGHPDRDAFSLSAGALLWVPLDKGKNVGDQGVRLMPKLVAAGFKHHIWWSVVGAFQYRPEATIGDQAPYPGNTAGSELSLGAAIYYADLDKRFAVGPEATVASVLNDGHFFEKRYTSFEALLGGHYNIARLVNVGAAVGTGVARQPGTPDLRILLRLAFAPMPGPKQAEPSPPAPTDRDQDGIIDGDDTCPDVHKSERPDPDRRGCPELDTDGDGIYDRTDQCVDLAQGVHPHKDKLGCPDLDTDGDLVFDSYDVCPSEPKGRQPDATREGCPLPDRDMDQIVDAVDACPDQAGAPDPDPKKNGCPGLVQIKNNQIVIVQPIFFATGKDTILSKSFPVLQAVANAMSLQPDIKRVAIEGHTDNTGKREKNQDLSERRAKAAMLWLVEHGIAAERLEAHGYGPDKPVADNATEVGRSANRRVDFRILDDAAP